MMYDAIVSRLQDLHRRLLDEGMRFRTGRRQPRTIYLAVGDEPSEDDISVGMMDTPELAALAVSALNAHVAARGDG